MKTATRHTLICLAMASVATHLGTSQLQARTTIRLDQGWRFHFGHASDVTKDFMSGTEYFNYLTKAKGIHNEGPYIEKFDDSDWTVVQVPHDFVELLPYAPQASHSHGYKTVGWRYPETSVGWYRYSFDVPQEMLGQHIELQFDGIFRNAVVCISGMSMIHISTPSAPRSAATVLPTSIPHAQAFVT